MCGIIAPGFPLIKQTTCQPKVFTSVYLSEWNADVSGVGELLEWADVSEGADTWCREGLAGV